MEAMMTKRSKDEQMTIRITPELRKEINAAVRDNVMGAAPLAEVGLRSVDGSMHVDPNALLWPEDSDLGDLRPLRDVKEINVAPQHPGCAELDLYVTTGVNGRYGPGRELETNVCILIRDGHVVGATSKGLRIPQLKAEVGFPLGPWDNA